MRGSSARSCQTDTRWWPLMRRGVGAWERGSVRFPLFHVPTTDPDRQSRRHMASGRWRPRGEIVNHGVCQPAFSHLPPRALAEADRRRPRRLGRRGGLDPGRHGSGGHAVVGSDVGLDVQHRGAVHEVHTGQPECVGPARLGVGGGGRQLEALQALVAHDSLADRVGAVGRARREHPDPPTQLWRSYLGAIRLHKTAQHGTAGQSTVGVRPFGYRIATTFCARHRQSHDHRQHAAWHLVRRPGLIAGCVVVEDEEHPDMREPLELVHRAALHRGSQHEPCARGGRQRPLARDGPEPPKAGLDVPHRLEAVGLAERLLPRFPPPPLPLLFHGPKSCPVL